MAKRGRLGGLARWRRHGNIPGAVTPRVLGGRIMASHGIVELRAHGFGGRFESDLQRAYRLGGERPGNSPGQRGQQEAAAVDHSIT